MPQADYSGQCDHTVLYRNGFNPTAKRGPAQNYICAFCRKQITEGADPLSAKRIRIIKALMRPGATINGVARETRTARATVRKWALEIDKRRALHTAQ